MSIDLTSCFSPPMRSKQELRARAVFYRRLAAAVRDQDYAQELIELALGYEQQAGSF
jgi:hypothetical protein